MEQVTTGHMFSSRTYWVLSLPARWGNKLVLRLKNAKKSYPVSGTYTIVVYKQPRMVPFPMKNSQKGIMIPRFEAINPGPGRNPRRPKKPARAGKL